MVIVAGPKTKKAKGPKSPILAGILNFLLYGIGYLYLGKRKVFGIVLFLGDVAFFAATGYAAIAQISISQTYVNINSIGFVIIGVALGYDAYQLARQPLSSV